MSCTWEIPQREVMLLAKMASEERAGPMWGICPQTFPKRLKSPLFVWVDSHRAGVDSHRAGVDSHRAGDVLGQPQGGGVARVGWWP